MDALRRIVQTLRVSARSAERRHGISGAQLFVLHQLAEVGTQSINELAARTFTHQSSVSTVVGRLVDGGYVMRRNSEHDGRRAEVTLTSAGRALLRKAPEPAQTHLIAALGRLGRSDRRLLARTLSALVREMGSDRVDPQMLFDDVGPRRPRHLSPLPRTADAGRSR